MLQSFGFMWITISPDQDQRSCTLLEATDSPLRVTWHPARPKAQALHKPTVAHGKCGGTAAQWGEGPVSSHGNRIPRSGKVPAIHPVQPPGPPGMVVDPDPDCSE